MKSLIIKKDDDKFSTIDKNDMLEVIGNHSHLNVIENKNQIHKDGTYLLINDEFNEYSLSLTCDNDIISVDGDNATFTAVLEHNGVVCEGKYITFHANEIEQSVKTDQNGIATFVYEPQGAGLVNVIASFMLLQETYEVLDCLFVDDGITDPKPSGTWVKSGTGSQLTIDDTGTTLYATSEGIYRNTTLINGDFEAIWEAKSTGGAVRYGVRNESSPFQYTQFLYFADDFLYYKLKRVGSTFTAQYSNDGVNWTNRSFELSNVTDNNCYFMFRIIGASSDAPRTVTYKNLRIYPI